MEVMHKARYEKGLRAPMLSPRVPLSQHLSVFTNPEIPKIPPSWVFYGGFIV